MNIQTLTLGPLATNCYLVRQDGCSRVVIIDPAANSKKLLAALQEQGLTLEAIFLTHAHFDHIGALKNLHAATQAPVFVGEADKDDPSHMCHDLLLYTDTYREGDELTAAGLRFRVLSTPGHTPGSVCLLCENTLFSGDTLFCLSAGRTDFPDGSTKELFESLKRLRDLSGDYTVCPGHNKATTLDFERKNNRYMRAL